MAKIEIDGRFFAGLLTINVVATLHLAGMGSRQYKSIWDRLDPGWE